MNQRIEHCLYQAGLTAQGCWDELDDYTKQGIEKFAELIVRECIHVAYNKMTIQKLDGIRPSVVCDAIKEHFGVES